MEVIWEPDADVLARANVGRLMRRLGFPESEKWRGPEEVEARPLSAPTEVHVVLSRRCAAGCTGCYVDATPRGAALSFEEACRILDELAEMGVFHVALGGGEALELDYLFAVAEHARARGITPNLTTSGLGLDQTSARKCAVFGQINDQAITGVLKGIADLGSLKEPLPPPSKYYDASYLQAALKLMNK